MTPSRIDTLFQKFIDTTCTKQEYDELMDLLQQNAHEDHVRAMLNQVYQAATRSLPSGIYVDQNGELQASVGMSVEAPAHVEPQKRSRSRMAVVLLLLVAGSLWFWYHRKGSTPQKQILTESFIKKIY